MLRWECHKKNNDAWLWHNIANFISRAVIFPMIGVIVIFRLLITYIEWEPIFALID
jgi:hypothetical protein